MRLQFIPTTVHGFLDYMTAVFLPVFPRLLGWSPPVKRLHEVMSAATAGQSVLTDYEAGVLKKLPMSTHLTLDVLSGQALVISALVMNKEPNIVRATLAGLGVYYIGAALMTEPTPRGRKRAEGVSPIEAFEQRRQAVGVGESGEGI